MPLVSVVLPTYNRAGTIGPALRSVLAQTHAELELIVVDDGPEDGTAEIVAGLNDPRVRYLRYPARMGVSRARNVGTEAARGDLIAYQDSDDEWHAEKLARQVAALADRPDVALVTCGFVIPQDPGRSLLGMRADEPVVDVTAEVLDHLPGCQCWLTRKSALAQAGGWDESLNCFEDWELGVRLAGVGRVLMVNDSLVIKPMTPGSLFSEQHFSRNLQKILARHEQRLRPHPRVWARYCNLIAQSEGVHGSMAEARRWYRKSIAAWPYGLRAWASLSMTFCGRAAFTRFIRSAKALRTRFPNPTRPQLSRG